MVLRRLGLVVGLLVYRLALAQAPGPGPGQGQTKDRAAPSPLPPEIKRAELAQLLAAHKGQPILINVFASFCEPCRAELPELGKFAERHPRIFMIGLAVDPNVEALPPFLAGVPKAFAVYRRPDGLKPLLPALRLPRDWNQSVPPGWYETIPLTFVYDAAGKFANGSVGQLSPAALDAFAKVDADAAAGAPRPRRR
jgi:thiol-disulfide isomerase/thioredoxin